MSARMSVSWNAVFMQLYVSAKRLYSFYVATCMQHGRCGFTVSLKSAYFRAAVDPTEVQW